MNINKANLSALYVAFNAAFKEGIGQAPSLFANIATVVPSTTGSEEYGWLGTFPGMREWLGDRVINGVQTHGYSIKNKDFELTVAVPRNAIEDDNVGVYTPMMLELGRGSGSHPDELVFGALANGHTQKCYDGQYFFDTDHPVIKPDGTTESQSNWEDNSGSGTPWYLLDCSRALKPLIFQERKKPEFVAKTDVSDDNVFNRKEYVYGVDSRCNVGYGFWQLAYGSRKDLTEDNLAAALAAMASRTGDHGKKLGIKATHLVVPASLEHKARKLVNASTLANGADNVLKGVVEVVVSPWL